MTAFCRCLLLLCLLGWSVFPSLVFAGAETRPLQNDFQVRPRPWYRAQRARAPATVDVSVVSEPEAEALFQLFRGNKGIAFNYPLYGCEARASAMAIAAENLGFTFGKVFVTGRLAATVANGDYEWDWHVSVVAFVRSTSGDIELRVFDPALFDHPVSLKDFKTKISGIEEIFFGSRFQYRAIHAVVRGVAKKENFKDSWLTRDLEHMSGRLLELSRMDEMLASKPAFRMVPFKFRLRKMPRLMK